MLSKLLKYELKATARLFLPLYLTIVIFSLINLFFLSNASGDSFSIYNLAMAISMIVYVMLMIGLVVMTLLVLIQRFYKNLLSDEGYLMFTLPVKAPSHILCKLIIAMLWTIASSLVAFGSILLMFLNKINITGFFGSLITFFGQLRQEYGAYSYLFSVEAIVLGLLSIASTILIIYAAIALGQLFNKHKLLASFGMYILLQIGTQIIMALTSAIIVNFPIFKPQSTFIPGVMLVNGILLIAILYFGVFTAGYFFLTNYILKRKLNLE